MIRAMCCCHLSAPGREDKLGVTDTSVPTPSITPRTETLNTYFRFLSSTTDSPPSRSMTPSTQAAILLDDTKRYTIEPKLKWFSKNES